MAITTPTSLQVPSAYETMLPKMAKQPLLKTLENLNYLYTAHRPPLASVMLTSAGALTRTARFSIPVTPSADDIRYGFETRIVCSAACNLTLKVEYCTAYTYGSDVPWTAIADHTGAHAVVVGGAGLVTTTDTGVIPANAIALRVVCSVSAGNMTPQHFLAFPKPDAPTVWAYPSGFILFDDGLLSSAQHAPINTEQLNRCRVSSDAIRRDRRQCLFTWCQDEAKADARVVLSNQTSYVAFPKVRCFLPGQALAPNASIVVTAKAIVTTDDASHTSQAVMLGQVDSGSGCYFTAHKAGSETIQTGTFTVTPAGDDALGRYVDIELAGKTASAKKTYIHSIIVSWRPGD